MKASLHLVAITPALVFVTIFDLLAKFTIYMKMANRFAAVGFLSWPLGVSGSLISVNCGNVSSRLFTCDI